MTKRIVKKASPPEAEDDRHALHSVPSTDEDDAFLRMVAERMPPKQREVSHRLGLVKSVYVECNRDKVLASALDDFMSLLMAKVDGRRDDGRAFFVTGESGAGKSRATRRMLANNRLLQPYEKSYGTINPVVSVTLDGPCTLKLLGRKIVRGAGYPLRQKLEQGELWDMLPEQLRLRRILVVHIDETQHMLRHTKTDKERLDVAKAFKGVMNNPDWPVSFVMSGMPETTEMARLDEQIERRQMSVFLSDVQMPEEAALVRRIVRRLCEPVGIDCADILATDMPDRISHAARHRYGRIAQVVVAGIQQALNAGDDALTRDHFTQAYILHSHARGRDDMIPFLIDHWDEIPAGSFILKTSDRE